MRRGLLLLRAAAEERSTVASGGGGAFATGSRCTAVPLAGAKAAERDAAQKSDGGRVAVRRSDSQQLLMPAREASPARFDLELTTPAGERETLRLPNPNPNPNPIPNPNPDPNPNPYPNLRRERDPPSAQRRGARPLGEGAAQRAGPLACPVLYPEGGRRADIPLA